MSADYTRNVSSSSSNNMHHVSSSSNKGGRPVSILPNMSIQNMSNWSLMNMNMSNMANMANMTNMSNMSNMSYPMMRPSVMVKQRKTNFTQREVDALINSVRQHQDTVLFGVAGGPGWAKAWTQVAAAVSGVEGIVRSEGDVRKKWTYLKWEAKNTSKPDRDSTSRAVLQILTSRQNQIDAANHHAAANLRGDMRVSDMRANDMRVSDMRANDMRVSDLRASDMRVSDGRDAHRDVQSSRSLLEELLVPPQPGVIATDGSPQPQPSASVGRPPAQPKQVDVKREPMAAASPRERPSPSSHPQPAMPQSAGHPASMSTPPGHPAGLPAGHPASSVHAQQLPPPRRSAPAPLPMRPPSPVLPPQAAAPPPEVCLRWNSYHSNMQATFPSLLNNEQFVDVTLACEGHSIKCHKVMLSACSSYFEELLSQNPCQHPIVLMKDLRFWEVQALVDFMYRGEVNVTQDKLPSLLAAAEALQIKGLAGPATNSHDGDSQRGNFEERRRKRPRTMPDPSEMPRNPVGRPRIHPKPPQQRQSGPVLPAQTSMPPRINVRPEQHLQRPIQMDDGPPPQRMKHSPPASPPVKMEPLETDLSNDSLDKLRFDGESGGSGDGSNHGDALVDLSQARYSINNGLQSERNRDRDRDQSDNEHDEDRHLDEEEDREVEHDRGQENERNQLRDHHDMDQENDQEEDHDLDHDQDMNQERDDQGLAMGAGSEDDQDSHSSDEDPYDNEPPQESRQQGDLMPDHLLGRL